jgi:DNA-binding MarR family transcriptional regulator
MQSLMKNNKSKDELPYIPEIDKIIHAPARLTIMSYLYVVDSADFLFLQNQLQLTPGNLSAHLRKLEEAGYVEIVKEFIERKPHTALALTKKGRQAFQEYQQNLKQVFSDFSKNRRNE